MDSSITNKYNIQKRLGKGAYGVVFKAVSKRSGRVVAVKRIYDAFRNGTDAQRTFREIVFLREFSDHPNIVKLLNVHRADNNHDLYLVFEFMNTDLHHVIRKGGILKDIHMRFIMFQLLNATQYLHSGGVIHRDQKPSNVLLDCDCNCKIADFGLARSLAATPSAAAPAGDKDGAAAAVGPTADQVCLTDYVATRWYRAPEILLGEKNYTKGVDIWSLGCILGEMLVGRPLFPGKNTVDQRERIFNALSQTPKAGGGKTKLDEQLAGQPDDALTLLRSLLQLQPARRASAEKALRSEYVSRFVPSKRRLARKASPVVPPFDDNVQLSVEEYRQKLYELISQQRKEHAA